MGNLRKAYGTTVTWPILSCLLTLMTGKIYPSSINSSTFLGCVTQPLWEVTGKVRAFMGTVAMSMMSMCPFSRCFFLLEMPLALSFENFCSFTKALLKCFLFSKAILGSPVRSKQKIQILILS